jgi:hypothetical protein
MNKYKEELESMVWQFAYRSLKGNRLVLTTGGLSALEGAFEVLGWDDPHYVEPDIMITCNIVGCHDWTVSGLTWDGLYLRLCSKHTAEQFAGKPCPPVKKAVIKKESKRDPITRCLPMGKK